MKITKESRKIVEAMKLKDINQSQLAEILGITRSMVNNWVKGRSNPSLNSLKKIASAIGMPLNFFLNSPINSSNAIGSNAVSEINDVQTDAISSKKDTEIELLKKEIENLKLKLEIEQLKKR
jgi:transcriptional regulator with XRE-family HTH domain